MLYLVFGERYAPGLAVGFFAGYVVYDMLHYYLHHFTPHGRVGRALRERHMRHHFQDDTRGFGISAPYWDEVFRTSPRSAGTPTNRKPRNERGRAHRRAKWRPQAGLDSGAPPDRW